MFFRKTESGFNVDGFAKFEVPPKFHARVNAVIAEFRSQMPPQGATPEADSYPGPPSFPQQQ